MPNEEAQEHPLADPSIQRLGSNLNTWIGLGGLVVGLITTCVVIGIYVGSIKDLPGQVEASRLATDAAIASLRDASNKGFEEVKRQVNEVQNRGERQGWEISGIQKDIGVIQGLISANVTEDARQGEKIRELSGQLQGTVKREEIIQWKSELENKNRGFTAPPLPMSNNSGS